MITASNPAFQPAPEDLRRLNRAVTWSVALHVVFIATLFLVPRDWISRPPERVLTISLGGQVGPRTTGTTSIGGRTVEQEAPPPKRPEPIKPIPTAQPATVPVKIPSPQTAKPVESSKPQPPAPPRPITTGPQVTQGSTQVDTGAKGQGFGLTSGGGGTGGETDLRNFCCPEYLTLLTQRIDAAWELVGKRQPEKGQTVIRFTLNRDGTVGRTDIVEASGSTILDRVSRNAIAQLKMTPLPAGYPDATLTVRVNFPYEGN